MKIRGRPASVRIKLLLLTVALAIALGTLYYTQNLVIKLQAKERQIVQLYAKSIEYIADSEILDTDFTFIFENVIKRIDFPLILTGPDNKVDLGSAGSGIRNLTIDSSLTREEAEEYIVGIIEDLGKIHTPITVSYGDSIILGKIYYGDSDLVQRLKYYPYLQIFFAMIFIIIAYVGFSYLKKSEQSNIWIGMAKETAHQLGTPISSLMGWSEILKMNYENPDKVLDVAEEVDSDLSRLNKITHRFSKIGSKPELKRENIYEIIARVISYFQRRLPQTGKNVSIELVGEKSASAFVNPELFEWVIENLIKNSLDAIGNNEGNILLEIIDNTTSIYVDITDNGKGIDLKRRKDIFRPGYSTKRRGWGLGLSLSKRIVQDYHKGKIVVKNSVINEGTTIRITLKKK